MTKRDCNWVIRRRDGFYLKHPRGELASEWTANIEDAIGYYYKADAKKQALEDYEVRRRSFFKGFLQTAGS